MNQGHIEEGEIVNLRTLKDDLSADETYALVKTPDMEVIRMVIPQGKEIREHSVKGEVTFHCLEGSVTVDVDGNRRKLGKDDWLFMDKERKHALKAASDTTLLVTILFTPEKELKHGKKD